MKKHWRKIHISPFQVISYGFLGVILTGTVLLMLPIATKSGTGATFLDALFTATSAVCVTGLIVQDTATYWSLFGQGVVITLIQIGGMGVVTVAVSLAMLSGRKIGLMQRSTLQEAIGAPKVGGIVRMTGFILRMVFVIELAGALLMLPVFCKEFGFFKGMWYALFHSISAFCNAGFDLMGSKEPFSSLTLYIDNPLINLTIMLLIVIGGIGFYVWDDIGRNALHIKKYTMQTKVVLSVTAVLIVIPALYFFFAEFSDMPFAERFWASLFQVVTPRTAGFNTVNLLQISEVGQMMMVMLMLIGGSPGSTAGGMKTTTIAVLLANAGAVFHRRESVRLYHRRIADQTVKNAATIFTMYIALFLLASLIISGVDKVTLLVAMYETASAIGTVGLTLGITPGLSVISKLVLISLMYFGRVGGLTLVFATLSAKNANIAKYPVEKLTVG